MEIPLNLPPGEKLQNFLDYLNAGVHERISSYSGSSGYFDGGFETGLSGRFRFDQGDVDLSLVLKYSPAGKLIKIVANADTSTTKIQDWKAAVNEFIHSVWAAAFTERKQEIFHRSFFCYIGEALDGEYWLQKKLRFAPVIPNDEFPGSQKCERVVCIDQVVEAIDDKNAEAVAQERAAKLAARLSLLLNEPLYRPETTSRWVYVDSAARATPQSQRCQLLFAHPLASCTQMPKKAELCPLGKWSSGITDRYRQAWEPLSLPRESRDILKGLRDAPPQVSEAFDRAARLFQVGAHCGQHYPSVGLAYRVAAVEAICQTEREIRDFTPFMQKYAGNTPEHNELYNFMYGRLRSSHFHSGEFPSGEFARSGLWSPFQSAESDYMKRQLGTCFWILRAAKINWMLEKLEVSPRPAEMLYMRPHSGNPK